MHMFDSGLIPGIPSVHPTSCPSIHSPIHPYICLFISSFAHPSTHPSFNYISICSSIVCPSVHSINSIFPHSFKSLVQVPEKESTGGLPSPSISPSFPWISPAAAFPSSCSQALSSPPNSCDSGSPQLLCLSWTVQPFSCNC